MEQAIKQHQRAMEWAYYTATCELKLRTIMSAISNETFVTVKKTEHQNSPATGSVALSAAADPEKPAEQSSPATDRAASSANPELQKPDQIELILHAQRCDSDRKVRQCSVSRCQTMKHALQHLKTCEDGDHCSVPLCFSSLCIISHWEYCFAKNCPVCLPFNQVSDSKDQKAEEKPAQCSPKSSLNHTQASKNTQRKQRGFVPLRRRLLASVEKILQCVFPIIDVSELRIFDILNPDKFARKTEFEAAKNVFQPVKVDKDDSADLVPSVVDDISDSACNAVDDSLDMTNMSRVLVGSRDLAPSVLDKEEADFKED